MYAALQGWLSREPCPEKRVATADSTAYLNWLREASDTDAGSSSPMATNRRGITTKS